MPFEIKVIAEPGSATLCGGCGGIGQSADESVICVYFKHMELVWTWGQFAPPKDGGYARLPECVKAERRAQEGA